MHLALTKMVVNIHPLEGRILTAATAITVNPKEPNIARMILLLVNKAHFLEPNTAAIR